MNIPGRIKKSRKKSRDVDTEMPDIFAKTSVHYDLNILLHSIEFIGNFDEIPESALGVQFFSGSSMSPLFVHATRTEVSKENRAVFNYGEKSPIYALEPDANDQFAVAIKAYAGKSDSPTRQRSTPAASPVRPPASSQQQPNSPTSDDETEIQLFAKCDDVLVQRKDACRKEGLSKTIELNVQRPNSSTKVTLKATFFAVNERLLHQESVSAEVPNLVHVTVIRAIDLKCTEKGGADGIVHLKRGGWTASTNRIPDNNNPVWNQKFFVPMSKTLSKRSVLHLKALGEAQVDLDPFCAQSLTQSDPFFITIPIISQGLTGISKKVETGRLELKLRPVYAGSEVDMKMYQQGLFDESTHVSMSIASPTPSLSEAVSYGDTSTISEVDTGIEEDEDNEVTAKEEAERIMKEKAEQESQLARIQAMELVEGDYTIMVHIIEVADLPAKDANGTSDPVVYVNCFDQIMHTRIKKGCINAVFDDLFTFELQNMKKDDLEGGVIRIDVKDADAFGYSKELIGSVQVDFDIVYYISDAHEIYRQWSSTASSNENHGRIKLSITIVGPGQKPLIHDRKKELEEEAQRIADGLDPPVFKLVPPVQQDLHFLQILLYRARELPPMDLSTIRTSVGIDAYLKIKFGDAKSTKSPTVTVKASNSSGGGGLLSVVWNARIMIPVMVPTMSNRIQFRMMDSDTVYDEIDVQKGKYVHPSWFPIYGSTYPVNINYAAETVKRQCTKPSEATYYRGSILMSLSEYTGKDKKFRKPKARTLKLRKDQLAVKTPHMSQYDFHVLLYSGSDLPSRSAYAIPHVSQDLTVKICIGSAYATATTKKIGSSEKFPGVVRWDELLKVGAGPIDLPTDTSNIPDIFIYLVREGENICFCRLKAVDTLSKGFDGNPRWYHLMRDPAVNQVPVDKFPGSLLMKLGMGKITNVPTKLIGWQPAVKPVLEPYTLFVHLYQARDLSPEDPSGLLDPLIKVRFNGAEVKSKIHKNTRNPNFFQTLRIETELPAAYNLWPEISIELWDWDIPPNPNDWVGTIRLSPNPRKIFRTEKLANSNISEPTYYSVCTLLGEPTLGEIMLDYEFILMDSIETPLPPKASIVPDMVDSIVEIIPVGLRDLRPKGLNFITNPFVTFQVGDYPLTRSTQPSKKPSTKNPNFKVETILIPCRIPKDPVFAPRLSIEVKDKRLGGFSNAVLGRCSIDLEAHMLYRGMNPKYKPPGGRPFLGCESSNPFLEEPTELRSFSHAHSRTSSSTLIDYSGQRKSDAQKKYTKGSLHEDEYKLVAKSLLDDDGDGSNITEPPKRKKHDVSSIVQKFAMNSSETFMIGRMEYDEEMEWVIGYTPFEEYPIFKGTKHQHGIFTEAFARLGYFKGIVRVYEDKLNSGDKPEDFGLAHPLPLQLDTFSRPHSVQIRLYVLKGYNIPAKDLDRNTSDPYLLIELGKTVISDRDNHLSRQIKDVKFYKYFEIDTKFPGSSKLKISVYDLETVGTDNLIGTTVVDLEDRWFNRIWREGELWKIKPNADGEYTESQVVALDRGLNTPTEIRQLWHHARSNPQGSLKLWIDILPMSDVSKYPPLDISPPPMKNYELRIIIYKARNWKKPGDIVTGMTDLFIKMKMEKDDTWNSTDIHFRAEQNMSFNWRMKFNVHLPLDEDKEGLTDISIQICDFDVLFNDILHEEKFRMREFFIRANQLDEPIHFFPLESSSSAVPFSDAMQKFCLRHDEYMSDKQATVDEEAGWGRNKDDQVGSTRPKKGRSSSALTENTSLVHRPSVLRRDLENYGSTGDNISKRSKATKKKVSMWSKLKEGLGFGPDPPNSGWLLFKDVGEICMSIEILPKRLADQAPAGNGRDNPNSNPELLPPEGRLDPMKMINPFYAIKTCLGNGILVRLTGVVLFFMIIAVFVMAGPTITDIFLVGGSVPYGEYLMLALVIVVVVGCCYSFNRVSLECGCGPSEKEIDEMEEEELTLPHMD